LLAAFVLVACGCIGQQPEEDKLEERPVFLYFG